MHSVSNLKYQGILEYLENTVFIIKRNQGIYTIIFHFQEGI